MFPCDICEHPASAHSGDGAFCSICDKWRFAFDYLKFPGSGCITPQEREAVEIEYKKNQLQSFRRRFVEPILDNVQMLVLALVGLIGLAIVSAFMLILFLFYGIRFFSQHS